MRLKGVLTEVGSDNFDEETQTINPTVVLNPPLDSELMREEIFIQFYRLLLMKHLMKRLLLLMNVLNR